MNNQGRVEFKFCNTEIQFYQQQVTTNSREQNQFTYLSSHKKTYRLYIIDDGNQELFTTKIPPQSEICNSGFNDLPVSTPALFICEIYKQSPTFKHIIQNITHN
jgi:hypothetical protein